MKVGVESSGRRLAAIVLAAGRGDRLRPLTSHLPKALVPVAGRPALLRLLDRLQGFGFGRFFVNAHYLAERVVETIKSSRHYSTVTVASEEEILGAGGGVGQFAPQLHKAELFLVHNCDIVTDLDIGRLVEHHLRQQGVATMSLFDCPAKNSVHVDSENTIRDIGGGLGAPVDGCRQLTYGGVAVMTPEIFDELPLGRPAGLVRALLALMERGKRVVGYVPGPETYWNDLGTPRDYLSLHRDILEANRPRSLCEKPLNRA